MKTLFKHQKSTEKDFMRIGVEINKLNKAQQQKPVHSGKTDPSNRIGTEGDYYVNTETKTLFVKKQGKWLG